MEGKGWTQSKKYIAEGKMINCTLCLQRMRSEAIIRYNDSILAQRNVQWIREGKLPKGLLNWSTGKNNEDELKWEC